MEKFVYIVFKQFNNGVDSWSSVHSVWMTKPEAEQTEINLYLNNKDQHIEYYVDEFEIGVEH